MLKLWGMRSTPTLPLLPGLHWPGMVAPDSFILTIDRALSGATIPGQSGSGSNSNEGVLCIPQNPSITGASPSDSLVSYLGHLLYHKN